MSYVISRSVRGSFESVVERVEDELAEEGFGVLCDIDVSATLEKKLGVEDFRDYRILGACNPPLAHEAMSEEVDLGALLPCNVIVYEDEDGVVVSAIDPEVMLSVVENDDLDAIASEVHERFDRVLDAVAFEG